MYTIRQAAARTGVGAPLIRAWERRYGVVQPTRTPSGYRLYDDAGLRVLLTMRTLVEAGWAASEAARTIRANEVALVDLPEPASPVATRARPGTNRGDTVERFVAAASAKTPRETEAVLDEILASGSYEAIVDDLLLPSAAALGDAWAAGRISVGAEHASSGAIARRLAAAFQAAGAPGPAQAVVGLPPGSRHELGALAFAVALRRRGVGVLYLGADVTVEGWAEAVTRTGARIAVIGIVTADDRASAADVIRELAARGIPTIALGGRAASADLDPAGRASVLPDRVVEAADVIAGAVDRRSTGRVSPGRGRVRPTDPRRGPTAAPGRPG